MLRVGRVEFVSLEFQRCTDHIARRIQQQDRTRLFLHVKEKTPRLFQRMPWNGACENSQRTPLIRNRELVARVECLVKKTSFNVLQVRKLLVIDWREEILADESSHGFVGRHNDVV